MTVGDRRAEREAEPGAEITRLGREERLEDARPDLLGDAPTCVFDDETDALLVHVCRYADVVLLGGALGDRVSGVREEVGDELAEAYTLAMNASDGAEIQLELRPMPYFIGRHA